MVIISDYSGPVNGKGEICIKSKEKSICPVCGGSLRGIGSRRRSVINADGDKTIYRIRRLCCGEGCGKIHHELPDSIVPYRRHSARTIEEIDEGRTDGLDMEISTCSRLQQFVYGLREYYRRVVSGLKEKLKETDFPACPKLKEIVRIIANENLWSYTRSAFCPV